MATRLYVANATPSFNPGAFKGSWTTTSGGTNEGAVSSLQTTKQGASITANTATSSVQNNALFAQWVSPALTAGATISGTVDWCIGIADNIPHGFFAIKPQLHIWVSTGNTSTVRGTVLSNYVASTISFPSSGTGEGETGIALTSVSALTGDHIIFEFGLNFNSTSNGGSCWYGATGATDLANGSTAVTTNPAWLNFSVTLPFTSATTQQLITGERYALRNAGYW